MNRSQFLLHFHIENKFHLDLKGYCLWYHRTAKDTRLHASVSHQDNALVRFRSPHKLRENGSITFTNSFIFEWHAVFYRGNKYYFLIPP